MLSAVSVSHGTRSCDLMQISFPIESSTQPICHEVPVYEETQVFKK